MEHTTETKIGKTLFAVTSAFSEIATETAEQKIKKLILRHAYDCGKVISKLSENPEYPLAMCENIREYTTDTR
jgi:hypothetical protein